MVERRLGAAADTDQALLARLPRTAADLIRASEELYGRVSRLDQGSFAEDAVSPARSLLSRLQRSF
jgi:regulator of CtrA degradation